MHHNKLQKIFIALIASSVIWPLLAQTAEDVVVSAAQNSDLHGTNGNAVTGSNENRNAILAGRDANDFTTIMLGFKDGSREATVMHHHAKGLTEDEIRQLAVYFSKQKPTGAVLLKPQTLKAYHE
jgi:cytochrome c553